MPQVHVSIIAGNSRVIVHGSFVAPGRLVNIPMSHRETPDDALARALWLCRHGKPEEADDYLDNFLRRN